MDISKVYRVFHILGILSITIVSGDESYLVVFLQSNDLTQVMAASGEEGGWCHVASPRLGWNQSLQASPFNQLIVSDTSAILGSGVEDKAVVVTTVGAVSVYMGSEHSVYSPLPLADLGKRYIISTCHIGTSIVLVIAASSDLTVDIVFKMSGTLTYSGRVFRDGATLSISLQKYQTLTLDIKNDLTGTIVTATEPIAVFIGIVSSTIYINRDVTTIATEQLVPVEHYGKEFVVPVYDFSQKYMLQVLGEDLTTVVTFNNGTSLTTNGFYQQAVGPIETLHFVTDKPVMTMLCRDVERYSGFTVVSPVTSYGKHVALYVGPYTLKISTKRSSSVTVWSSQGIRAAVTWEDVTNTNYKVGTVTSAATFVTSSEDFSVMVFHSDHLHRGGYTGPFSNGLPDSTSTKVTATVSPIPDTTVTEKEDSTPTKVAATVSPLPDTTITEKEDETDVVAIGVGVFLSLLIVILIIIIVILIFYIRRKIKSDPKSNAPAVNPHDLSANMEASPTTTEASGGRNSRYAELGRRETAGSDYTALHGNLNRESSTTVRGAENPGYEDLGALDLDHTDYTALQWVNNTEHNRN